MTDTLDANNLLKCNIFHIADPFRRVDLYVPQRLVIMQPIIHLPNKVHSLIRLPSLHGTMRERIVGAVKRAFMSTLAKYKLMSTDSQFVEKEFLRDASKAYNLFLNSLTDNDLQRVRSITSCTLFRVHS